jgi:Large polyvalent protein-associated domain 3
VNEHVDALASSSAEILANTTPVRLPAKAGHDARKGAFEAAKQVSANMREQGLAIRNFGSGALIELNVRGLKHAKTMSGDIRSALLMHKLPSALARAVYFKSEKPDARKAALVNLVAYHKFAVPVEHDGGLALAVMHVEEDRQGAFLLRCVGDATNRNA